MGFFSGRVYAPSAVRSGFNDAAVSFAGYHTQKPKNGLGDYRTIGRLSLHASQPLLVVGSRGDSGLDAGNLPLLLDPIPAPQRGLVGAGEAGSKVVPVNHVPHESCLSDLTRASDRLDEAACLAKTSDESRSLSANESQRPPFTIYSIR